VAIEGRSLDSYAPLELASKIQMIFQDPFMSLNPKLSVGTMLTEAAFHLPKKERRELVNGTLRAVGLEESAAAQYPHQFSGGQRQRIAIARALIKRPKIIVADEPLSALDLTIQNQLLDLFAGLKKEFNVSFVFISHDLAVTGEISDYLIVMQNGKIVEKGTTAEVMSSPGQEYTKRLLAAVPRIG
jgi:ABC-type microcin C transport system duplicated ATPase subunit YejF